jgi:glycosyltransferase involved in cell wall biosynthesis
MSRGFLMRYNWQMKVAIDISQIVYGTGVSVYVKSLVEELIRFDKDTQYVLFGGSLRRQKELHDFVSHLEGNVTSKIFPISPTMADFIWNRLHALPVERLVGSVDIVHTSDWSEPSTIKAKKVTTVHDLTPFKFANETPQKIREVHERKLARVKAESNAIIVPSLATKNDLVEMGFDAEKIHVIYEAVSQSFSAGTKRLEVSPRFNIHGNYILAVGTGKRKNLDRLIDAFSHIKEIDQLVIVGQGESTQRVKYVGRVSDEELVLLYQNAECLAYVSLYEGFGLPILEAFRLGTPVVTSNIGSMKEVAGNAAVLVDPTDVKTIQAGIEKALNTRNKLVKLGVEREKEFSWKKAARETLGVYKQL